MLYQKLLPATNPYVVYTLTTSGNFPIHKHHEIELIYSPANTVLELTVDDKNYSVLGGEVAIVGTLSTHETKVEDKKCEIMILEIGPLFLKEHFQAMSELDLSNPKINLSSDDEITQDLKRCLDNIYAMYLHKSKKDELLIIGNIYRICSHIIKLKSANQASKSKKDAKKLKKALNYIHTNYASKITLDTTANIIGYSKGKFCKAFKSATGLSFHTYLNNYRITNSCYLLTNTDMSIGAIAEAVGFSEFKTFCRVFRAVVGKTPSEYRLAVRKSN
jgi:YesN/AraC family two-component response regulator